MADIKQQVRRHFEEVWNKGNFDAMNDLYDESYEGRVPMVGKVDRAQLRSVVGAFRRAFPDLNFEIKDIIQEGDRVAVSWRASGTSKGEFMGIPATNNRGTVHGVSMFEIRNGKIARDLAEMDIMSFFQQMGLQLPMKGQAAPEAEAPTSH